MSKGNIEKIVRFIFYVILMLVLFALVCAALGQLLHTIEALYVESDSAMKLIMFLIGVFLFQKASPVALRILGVSRP